MGTSQSRYTVSYEQVSYATAIHNITPVTPATESHVQPSQKLHQHLISSPKWRSVCLCTIVVCVYKRSGSGIVDTPLLHPPIPYRIRTTLRTILPSSWLKAAWGSATRSRTISSGTKMQRCQVSDNMNLQEKLPDDGVLTDVLALELLLVL